MKTARIYVFGDSITYGAWDSQGGWCDRLKQKLHQRKIDGSENIKYQVFNLGIGGETSRSLLKRFKSEIDARNRADWPAVILIATGANDTRSAEGGTPVVPIAEYRQNLEKLILIAKEYTDKILLVGIAPVEHAIQQFKGTVLSNELLQSYDAVMTEVADAQAIAKIDVMSQFLTVQSPIFSPDGVHPNDNGHEIIEQAVAVKLDELLKE
jgi:lysophospholipase L1-like esterase